MARKKKKSRRAVKSASVSVDQKVVVSVNGPAAVNDADAALNRLTKPYRAR